MSENGRIPSAIGWVGQCALSALLSKRMEVEKKGKGLLTEEKKSGKFSFVRNDVNVFI